VPARRWAHFFFSSPAPVEARQAQELLGDGGVTGKIVLVCNGSSLDS
jgi:hypothetical protein